MSLGVGRGASASRATSSRAATARAAATMRCRLRVRDDRRRIAPWRGSDRPAVRCRAPPRRSSPAARSRRDRRERAAAVSCAQPRRARRRARAVATTNERAHHGRPTMTNRAFGAEIGIAHLRRSRIEHEDRIVHHETVHVPPRNDRHDRRPEPAVRRPRHRRADRIPVVEIADDATRDARAAFSSTNCCGTSATSDARRRRDVATPRRRGCDARRRRRDVCARLRRRPPAPRATKPDDRRRGRHADRAPHANRPRARRASTITGSSAGVRRAAAAALHDAAHRLVARAPAVGAARRSRAARSDRLVVAFIRPPRASSERSRSLARFTRILSADCLHARHALDLVVAEPFDVMQQKNLSIVVRNLGERAAHASPHSSSNARPGMSGDGTRSSAIVVLDDARRIRDDAPCSPCDSSCRGSETATTRSAGAPRTAAAPGTAARTSPAPCPRRRRGCAASRARTADTADSTPRRSP